MRWPALAPVAATLVAAELATPLFTIAALATPFAAGFVPPALVAVATLALDTLAARAAAAAAGAPSSRGLRKSLWRRRR
jgi:hypothetical protein